LVSTVQGGGVYLHLCQNTVLLELTLGKSNQYRTFNQIYFGTSIVHVIIFFAKIRLIGLILRMLD
jgi:hypothetical protein